MAREVDIIVMGLGVGGEDAAEKLAEAGLSVVGIERRLVGGECPYWGCVPSKMMIRGSNAIAETRRVHELAGQATVTPDWAPIAKRIREEATDNWDDIVAVKRFTDKGGIFVRGSGRLTGPKTIEVDGESYVGRRGILLDLGTSAVIPPIEGLAGTPYWTNKEIIEAETLPASLIVLGGGAIGFEMAQVVLRFGVQVTIVEAGERVLAHEEPESSALASEVLTREGATIKVGMRAERVEYDGANFTVHLAGGDSVSGEKLLVATGRKGNFAGVGLENVGLDPNLRTIEVDERMRVIGASDLWAIGDVTGHGAFTHISMYQAEHARRDIMGEESAPAMYHASSRVTFTDPEIGCVGLTEAEAKAKGLTVRTAVYPLPSSTRGWIHKTGNDGFIKLVAVDDVLVGATSAGPTGGEVLGWLAVAVHARVPIASLRNMIFAYPTFHRAIEATLALL